MKKLETHKNNLFIYFPFHYHELYTMKYLCKLYVYKSGKFHDEGKNTKTFPKIDIKAEKLNKMENKG